eukprot:gene19192-29551_t
MGGKGKDKNGKGAGILREAGDRADRPERPRVNGKDGGKGKGYKGGGKASKPVVEEKPAADASTAEKRIFFDAAQTKTVPAGMTWASALRNKKEQPKTEDKFATETEAEPEKAEQTVAEPETAENEPWPARAAAEEDEDETEAPELDEPQPLPKAVMQQVRQAAPAPAAEAVNPPASLPPAPRAEPAPASASLPAPMPAVISQPLAPSPPASLPPSAPAHADKKPEEPKPKKTASRRFHDQTESVVLPCGFNAPASKAKFSFCAADSTGPAAVEKARLPNESEWAHEAEDRYDSDESSSEYARSLYEQQRGGAIGPARSQQSPSNMAGMNIQSMAAMGGSMQNMGAMRGNSSGGRSNYYQNQGGNFDSFTQYSQYSQAYPAASYSAYQSEYGPVGNYGGGYGRDAM